MNLPKASAKSSRPILTASIASLFAMAGSVVAQQTWTGGTSTDWNTGANWSGGAVPGGVNAIINSTPPNIATITADLVATPVDIFVGNAAGTDGRLDHTAGVAGTGNNNWMFVGTNGGTGVYNLADTSAAGGTFTGYGTGSGSLNVGGPSTTAGRLYVGGRDNGTAGTGTVNVNTTGTVKIGNDLVVGSRGGTGVFNMDAGTVTTNGWNFIGVENGLAGGTGTFRMSGGTFTQLLSRTYVGLGNATGSMLISGGTFNNTGTSLDTQFAIGVNNLANATTPSVTMSGGTLNANRLFTVGGNEGFGGNGGSTGAGKGAFVMNGESALLNVTGEMWVGNQSGSIGTMDISAGTVKVDNWVAIGRNASQGTLTLSGTGRIEKTGAGNFEVGGGAGGAGILNLDGGTLNTHNITRNGAGSGTVNLNGGVLQANASNVTFMQNLTNVFVKAGGAKIDTQQFNITIAQPLTEDPLSVGGGLAKTGSGELALTGSNTFSGQTEVNGGTLALAEAGSINFSSGIHVNGANAKLLHRGFLSVTPEVTVTTGTVDGTGMLDLVTVEDGTGGMITNGNGTGMTLNIGTLTFDGAGDIAARLNDPFTPALSVGTLTTGAVNAAAKVTIGASTAGGIWTNGQTYTLINYVTLNGGLSAFEQGAIAGLSSRQSATLADTGFSITLAIAGDFPVWTGALDNRWTTAVLAEPKNWVLQTGGGTTDFIAGDAVIFNDDPGEPTVIDISDGDVDITTAAFLNNAISYTITSSGGHGITGGAITKTGAGSVTLATANSHVGGTTLNSGTLNINNAAALGAGTFTIAGGAIDNTSLDPVAISTNNAVRLTGSVTFNGTNALDLGTGVVTLGTDAAAQFIDIANLSALPGASLIIGGPVTSAEGGTPGQKTLSLSGAGNTVFNGNITRGSAAALVLDTTMSGTLTLAGAANAITTLNMNGGGSSVVDLGAGNLTMANGGGNILQTVGGGSIVASGGGTLTIGSANGDFGTAAGTMLTVAARIAGTVAVDFYSPNGALGAIVLEAANTHIGGTNVENVRLVIPAGGAINALNTANAGQLNVGTFNGGQAILELSGGTINATKGAAPSAVVGNANGSVGAFRVTEGVFNSTGEFWVGSAAGAYGSFTMSGGEVNVGNWLPVGRNGSGFMEMSGGVLNVTGNNFTMGSFTGANGTLAGSFGVVNLTGGTVNITNTATDQGGFIVAESGAAHLTVDGTAELNISGARGLHFATNASGVGVANLNGGTIRTPLVQRGAGTGILNFDGGKLQAAADSGTFLQGLTAAYLNEGGAILDDGGFFITIGQPLLAPTGDGVSAINVTGGSGYIGAPLVQISGDGTGATAVAEIDENGNLVAVKITNPGVNYTTATIAFIGGGGNGAFVDSVDFAANTSGGFTKQGAGMVTLSAANTYTGPTVIESGILMVTGSISGTSLVDVKAGAILDVSTAGLVIGNGSGLQGSGQILGNVNLAAGSILAPGNGVGTLTVSGDLALGPTVALSASGALQFELGAIASSDRVNLTTGTLAIGNGVLAFDDFAFTALAGLEAGVYTLFDGVSPIFGTLDEANASGTFGPGFTGTLDIADDGNDLVLNVVPEPGSAALILGGLAALCRRRRRGGV